MGSTSIDEVASQSCPSSQLDSKESLIRRSSSGLSSAPTQVHIASGNAQNTSSSEPSQRRPDRGSAWAVGHAFPVVAGRLSFAAFSSHDDANRRQDELSKKLVLTADYHLRYQAFAKDFGPISLGVLHSFCRFMRKHWDDSLRNKREMLYYTVIIISQKAIIFPACHPQLQQFPHTFTNTGACFAAGICQCTDKLRLSACFFPCRGTWIHC
jgi:hypothetical protein